MKGVNHHWTPFLVGALVATAATSFILLRWHQHQSQLFWVSVLDQHVRLARQLNQGDSGALRANLERRLPSLVRSVSSFGRNEQTLPVLRQARELLLENDRELPSELQPMLQGL